MIGDRRLICAKLCGLINLRRLHIGELKLGAELVVFALVAVKLKLAQLVQNSLSILRVRRAGSASLGCNRVLHVLRRGAVLAAALSKLRRNVCQPTSDRGLRVKAAVEVRDLVAVHLRGERILRARDSGNDAVAGLTNVLVYASNAELHVAKAGADGVAEVAKRRLRCRVVKARVGVCVDLVLTVEQPREIIAERHVAEAAHAPAAAEAAAPATEEQKDNPNLLTQGFFIPCLYHLLFVIVQHIFSNTFPRFPISNIGYRPWRNAEFFGQLFAVYLLMFSNKYNI